MRTRTYIQAQRRAGFTLVEICLVLIVVAVLMTVALPMAGALFQKSRLAEGADLLSSEMDLARQLAELENREVEFRFYKLPSEMDPVPRFRAFQTVVYDIDTSDPAAVAAAGSSPPVKEVSPLRYLPDGVVFFEGTESTLLGGTTPVSVPTGFTMPDGTTGGVSGFRYRPSGITDLGLNDEWTVTLVEERELIRSGGAFPPDFATIQIESFTGTHRMLRPN